MNVKTAKEKQIEKDIKNHKDIFAMQSAV